MLDQLLSELKYNARLRIALSLVVAVLCLYLILAMREASDRSAREYRSNAIKLGRLQFAMKQGDWPQRLSAAKTLRAELESTLWRGDTLGLARASFQDWLNLQTQRASLTRAVIAMGTADEQAPSQQRQVSDTDDIWKVRAKLTFDFTPDGINKLLELMAASTHRVVIERLHVTKEPVARVEMTVLAYFQKSESSRSNAH